MGNRLDWPFSAVIAYGNTNELLVAQLYCSSHPQNQPENIVCVRVKYVDDIGKFVTNIEKTIGNLLSNDNLWFRGLIDRNALTLSLAFLYR